MEENRLSFEDWRTELIKTLNAVPDYKIRHVQIDHKLTEQDVYTNYEIFEKLYNKNKSPYDAILLFDDYIDDFVRPLGEYTDYEIKEQFINRDIEIDYDIHNISTEDLEDALDGRWDTDYKSLHYMSNEELEDELKRRNGESYGAYSDNFRENLAEILHLSNGFSYTDDELINLVKENLHR